jgi:uncharacterized protein YggE
MKTLRNIVAIAVILLPLSSFAQRTITVMGAGSAVVKPDHVILSLTSSMQDKSVQGAFAKNEEFEVKLRKVAAEVGVPSESIKMRTYVLNPTYDYSNTAGGPPKLIGYNYIAIYELAVMDIRSIAKGMDAVSSVGATNVTVDSYASTTKDEKLEDDAMEEALEMAREKASFLAKRMGGTVGDIISISDAAAEGGGGAAMSEYEREEQERRGSSNRINPQAIVRSVSLKVTFSVK